MNGFLLLIPFLLIRFGLLSAFNRGAVKRAAYFPPLTGNEIFAYWVYQISNAAIFVYLCCLNVMIERSWLFFAGLFVYVLGLVLCAVSMKNFASPSREGLNVTGIYRFSRNDMLFTGCALLTRSLLLYGLVVIFQISSHWIILSEERWCIGKFGDAYREYMKEVRRYI